MFVSGIYGSTGFSAFDFASSISHIFREGPASPPPPRDDGSALRDLARLSLDARRALGQLELDSRGFGRGLRAEPRAISASSLGLSASVDVNILTSTEEVNATPTSFSPFVPTVSGTSTSELTLSGVYTGEFGESPLTFQVQGAGIAGSTGFQINVLNGSQTVEIIEIIEIADSYVTGTEITTRFGLTLSFSAGTLVENDRFTIDASATIGSVVDPDLAIDGTGNDNPNFEYGLGIAPGAIEVNGTSIQIVAGDTLNAVLDRISSSEAGVTASFDAQTETVSFTSTNGDQIALGADDTGFFDATKLPGALPEFTTGGGEDLPLSQSHTFASVRSGTIEINGIRIAIDVASDTLLDVLDRINTSGARVIATVDEDTGKVAIRSGASGSAFELSNGTSGFFDGLQIEEGSYQGRFLPGRPRENDLEAVEEPLRDLSQVLDKLFKTDFGSSAIVLALKTRGDLRRVLDDAFGSSAVSLGGRLFDSGLGIAFRFDESTSSVLEVDSKRLRRALDRKPEEVVALLFGDEDKREEGLAHALDAIFAATLEQVADKLGPGGGTALGIDVFG